MYLHIQTHNRVNVFTEVEPGTLNSYLFLFHTDFSMQKEPAVVEMTNGFFQNFFKQCFLQLIF